MFPGLLAVNLSNMNNTGGVQMVDESVIPIRLAAALLLKRGEISLMEIKALPGVEDDDDYALAVANVLARQYDIEYVERSFTSSNPDSCETLVLKRPAAPTSKRHGLSNSGMRRNTNENLAESIRKKFEPLGGVELELPPR